MWEDFIHIGSDYGEMPGGWYVPEIGVPNPVDVGTELRDAPGELIDVLPDVVNINPPK